MFSISDSCLLLHQQNMLMLQRPGRPGSTQEGWEQNSTFRSSLNTPGACQEWLGIVWRVCASSCQELRVPGRVRSNWPPEPRLLKLLGMAWSGEGEIVNQFDKFIYQQFIHNL